MQPICTSRQIWRLPRSGDFWRSLIPSFCFWILWRYIWWFSRIYQKINK